MNRTATNLTTIAALLAAPASIAFAHGEGDIGLLLSGNQIVTAIADDAARHHRGPGERVDVADRAQRSVDDPSGLVQLLQTTNSEMTQEELAVDARLANRAALPP